MDPYADWHRPAAPPRPRSTSTTDRPARATPPTALSARLPADLAGPVDVVLARAQDTLPGPRSLRGGTRYELKRDGFRGVLVRDHLAARLWSQHGTYLTPAFPEIAEAAARLPAVTVVDGELVIYDGNRLSFDLLLSRMSAGPRRAPQLARDHPAHFIAFDVLAAAGQDLRREPWRRRRQVLEHLDPWAAPLQLSPVTADVEQARAWMDSYRPAGIEGIVAKGADTTYSAGKREWIKTKSRETTEVIVGAVIGPASQPDAVVAGLYHGGHLVMVGRTVILTRPQSAQLAELLRPARADHPWPHAMLANRFGRDRRKVALTKVDPTAVWSVPVLWTLG